MDQDEQKDYGNSSVEPGIEASGDLTKPEEGPGGYPQEKRDWNYNNVYQQPKKLPQSNMALASLVMGIIAIVTSCCCYGGLIFGSLGIIFALLSRTEDRFEGYAKAGIITSVIALVLVVLVVFAFFIFAAVEGIQSGGVF
ncbi:DUF4190 domain-containing protein [Lachnospiraceae bacterium 54-53]